MKSAVFWAFLVLALVCLSSQASADAVVVQDSCVAVGRDQVRVYFTVINLYLPRAICSFDAAAKTQPQPSECAAVDCGAPANWSCFLNAQGGAGFGADAVTPPASFCIEPGSSLGGFYITIDPGFCCYTFRFADASGVEFVQNYACFTLCDGLPVEPRTWGSVKQIYAE